jgi:hypothetical protein
VSELFLRKLSDKWQLNEKFRLPEIEHGDTPDSVYIPGSLTVEKGLTVKSGGVEITGNVTVDGELVAKDIYIGDSDNKSKAITLNMEQVGDNTWRLRFTGASVSPLQSQQ